MTDVAAATRTCSHLAATWLHSAPMRPLAPPPVRDDELLAEGLAQLLGPGAGDEIGPATSCERHDDPDGFVGPRSLGRRNVRSSKPRCAQSHGPGRQTKKIPTAPPILSLVRVACLFLSVFRRRSAARHAKAAPACLQGTMRFQPLVRSPRRQDIKSCTKR